MNRARLRVVSIAGATLALAGIAFALLFRPVVPAERPAAERPRLLLLTSLPLIFGEDFSLQGEGSPALKALKSRYQVVPISVSSRSELARGRLLVMAQPRAQRPEDLVALDEWVRKGGRVLLFADPALEWPSDRPLGDPTGPAPMFMDTGLLGHWGLRLDSPDDRGPATRLLAGYTVLTVSPGLLFGRCEISPDRLVAHCRIGKGQATVVADGDLLDGKELSGQSEHNLDAVLGELALLAPN
jgi:hypothetical protein